MYPPAFAYLEIGRFGAVLQRLVVVESDTDCMAKEVRLARVDLKRRSVEA